ncbi:hypothetical protein WHR41_07355 [Cladosporium halotolerans]|uniref:Rhodopsin domain-containing protein n=1 Tax=Cladosporium halotolerans TaxID=1052096 RepID=A0AB34KLQ5_9PEZI
MATPSNTIPDGHRAPLIKLDENHHGSWLVICSAFGLVIVLLTLIIRVYLRYKVSPPFAADDIVLTAATALSVIQCSLVFASVHRGDGTSIDLIADDNLVPVQQLNYAANLFYILALYASKACVVLLFKRISSGIMHKKIAWVALIVTITAGFISILLCALRCDLTQPWIQFGAQCSSLYAQWQAIAAFDIITEVGLFAMAVHLVWGLQTAVSGKFRVVFAFGLRLPVIAIAGLHLHYIKKEINSPNQPLEVVATICRQTEIFYAIMASTIPCLRPFLASFFTGFGAMGGETVIAGSQVGGSNSREKSAYALGSMQSADSDVRRSKRRSRAAGLRPSPRRDNFGNTEQGTSYVSAADGDASSSRAAADASSVTSNDSTRMIIKKEVQWHVDSERGDAGRAM